MPSEFWVDGDAFAAITETASEAVSEIRRHLPTLADDLYLIVNQTGSVIPETGDGGFTVGPQCIRWDVDPTHGVASVARAHLRHTLFHECHHAVRLQRRPADAELSDWVAVAVFEGLASVFEAWAAGFEAPWRGYDPSVIAGWANELLAQPIGDDWRHWKFQHPDGRKLIAYKVGSWLADKAINGSGRSAADLVWASPDEVCALGGVSL